MHDLLAALDLQWVHWPSAVFGVLLLFGTFYGVVSALVLVGRVVRWVRRRRRTAKRLPAERASAPCPYCARLDLPHCFCEADPIEGAYTVPQIGVAGHARGRGPRRPRYLHAPRERPLTRMETQAILRRILGDPSDGRSWT